MRGNERGASLTLPSNAISVKEGYTSINIREDHLQIFIYSGSKSIDYLIHFIPKECCSLIKCGIIFFSSISHELIKQRVTSYWTKPGEFKPIGEEHDQILERRQPFDQRTVPPPKSADCATI
jgi:hypothetical protein